MGVAAPCAVSNRAWLILPFGFHFPASRCQMSNTVRLLRSLNRLLRAPLDRLLTRLSIRYRAAQKGMRICKGCACIEVVSGGRVLRLAQAHQVYVPDLLMHFDYYHGAVVPVRSHGRELVDYSSPRYHDVPGFDDFPVLFPSLAEPVVTTTQYLDFAGLAPGMTILDLGAYSGLTSILFARAACPGGLVVAVDADPDNIACMRRNIGRFTRVGRHRIEILEAAVWKHADGLEFSCEGNMGSSAVSIVGRERGPTRRVPSITLGGIVERFVLARVDFVKCDIEGAEAVIFSDQTFFHRFRPRIIIEVHIVDGKLTTAACERHLGALGYDCRLVAQHGVHLPLLECTPRWAG